MNKLLSVANRCVTVLTSLVKMAWRVILILCHTLWRVLNWRYSERLLLLVGGIMVVRVVYRNVIAWLPPFVGPYLFWGTLLILVGSIASIWPESKRRTTMGMRIAVLALGVTIGSLLTTFGWNELDDHYRKRAQLVELALEWELNDWRAQDIAFIWSKHAEIARASVYLYPKVSADAARRAIDIRSLGPSEMASAALAFLMAASTTTAERGPGGKAMYPEYELSDPVGALFFYCLAADELNRELDAINRLYTESLPPEKLILKTLAETFGKEGAFDQFRACHQAVGEWLKAAYPELLAQAEQIPHPKRTIHKFTLPPSGEAKISPMEEGPEDPNNRN